MPECREHHIPMSPDHGKGSWICPQVGCDYEIGLSPQYNQAELLEELKELRLWSLKAYQFLSDIVEDIEKDVWRKKPATNLIKRHNGITQKFCK